MPPNKSEPTSYQKMQAEKLRQQTQLEAQRQVERDAKRKEAEERLEAQKRHGEDVARQLALRARQEDDNISAIVQRVRQLRRSDPSANAGSNSGGDTAGGTENPVHLPLNVWPHMRWYGKRDSSDSAGVKINIPADPNPIFIHIKLVS